MRLFPWAQHTLLYIGQLTAVLAEKDLFVVLDREDLHSAFNLFKMPHMLPGWGPLLQLCEEGEMRPARPF